MVTRMKLSISAIASGNGRGMSVWRFRVLIYLLNLLYVSLKLNPISESLSSLTLTE